MNTKTVEQETASQIGETITCWLAKELEKEWLVDDDEGETEFCKLAIAIRTVRLDGAKISAQVKLTRCNQNEKTEVDLTIDDPKQQKLPGLAAKTNL